MPWLRGPASQLGVSHCSWEWDSFNCGSDFWCGAPERHRERSSGQVPLASLTLHRVDVICQERAAGQSLPGRLRVSRELADASLLLPEPRVEPGKGQQAQQAELLSGNTRAAAAQLCWSSGARKGQSPSPICCWLCSGVVRNKPFNRCLWGDGSHAQGWFWLPLTTGKWQRDPVPHSPNRMKVFKFGRERRTNSDASALCWPYLTQYRALIFLGEANSPWETLTQVLWVLLKIPDIKTGQLPSSN